jgi:REP element-mobilizing transposase RayT
VRQCFLCGRDPVSGKDFGHRKQWLEDRFRFLAGVLGIDVLGFALMSNHFHIILRNRPDVVATWDDREVARRWLTVCPPRKTPDGLPEEPTDAELATISGNPVRLAEIRRRLSDISWFMRLVTDPLARRANAEEEISGRFWQGRFRSVKLCDEAAILACNVYVDLNPIRAGLATTPEESEFTSAQRRIESLAFSPKDDAPAAAAEQASSSSDGETLSKTRSRAKTAAADQWLAPLPLDEHAARPGPAVHAGGARCSDRGFLPVTLEEYLRLLDWTGRQYAAGKRGAIPASLQPILARLQIDAGNWLSLVGNFGRFFHRVAGQPDRIAAERTRHGSRFRAGRAHLLGPPATAV